jgi:hypothetical protein
MGTARKSPWLPKWSRPGDGAFPEMLVPIRLERIWNYVTPIMNRARIEGSFGASQGPRNQMGAHQRRGRSSMTNEFPR